MAAGANATPARAGAASRGVERPGSKTKEREASRRSIRSLRSSTAEAGPRKRTMRVDGTDPEQGIKRAPEDIMAAMEDMKGEPQAQGSSLEGAEHFNQEYAQVSRYHAGLGDKAKSKRSSDSIGALQGANT